MTRRITSVLAVLTVLALVASAAAATPAAAQSSEQADRGPGEDQGPPDFVSDLLDALLVPDFVKHLF